MEHQPALYALIRLHAEIGGQIQDNKRQAEKLRSDMIHVEAVLHMLDPSFNARKIAAKRKRNGNSVFKRGDVWRGALAVLRDATEPMTSRQIVEAMLKRAGAQSDRKQVRDLACAVQSSLRNHRNKTVETVGEGLPNRWRVISS